MAEPSKRKRIAVVVVLAITVAAGATYWRSRPAEEAPNTTFYGNVDIRDVTLAFRVGGRVAEVLKKEGDVVAVGDVLAKLDSAPYQLAVDQAQAAVDVARAHLKLVEAGSRPEDIRQARALLAERKAARSRARDNLVRTSHLAEVGVATQQSLVDARTGAEQASASVKAAEAAAAKQINGPRAEDLAIARASVTQAETALATAKLALADTELEAKSAGVVVTRAIEPGAMVGAGSPALVVALSDPVWIRAFAGEAALAEIAPGTHVAVYTDARPTEPYEGQVGYVAAQAEFTPKNVETEELRTSLVYRFRVIVSEHDGGLRQGMPCTIQLTTTGSGGE